SFFLVMLFLSVVGIASTVEARDLEGRFAFTQARTCTQTAGNTPFVADASGAPTIIPAAGVFRQAADDTGILTFNEDGTGTNTGRSRTMNITDMTVGDSILSISDFSTPFTFKVNNDNTVDISFGVTTFSTVLGGGTGNTGTVTGRLAQIQLGKDGNTFVGVNRNAITQETVVTKVVGDGTRTQFRICTRSTTGVRIRNDDRDD